MQFLALLVLFALLAVCERPPRAESDHSAHDHTSANHGPMHHSLATSPGAADAPQELQFIDTMIAHHQGAIQTAQMVDTRSRNPEIRKLAEAILREQRGEIALMQEWRKLWFGEAKPAVNMELPGMMTGMSGMDMSKLDLLKAGEFDAEFARQMIVHHEGAVEMAKALKAGDAYPELKRLAESIIRSQSAEIEKMKKFSSGTNAAGT